MIKELLLFIIGVHILASTKEASPLAILLSMIRLFKKILL